MTLRDRQEALRRQLFVGREAEIEAVRAALVGEIRGQVFLVHGPGGMGKSALLLELAARHPRALYLDARELDPDPALVAHALAPVLRGQPPLILLDTVELIAPLDGWLRESFIPSLPEGAVLLLAGRAAPSAAWHTVSGWGTIVRAVALGPLTGAESRALLERRGVPGERHDELLAFSHGNPLALCLAADALAENAGLSFAGGAPPDLVQALLAHLLVHLPSDHQRAALEAAAVVRALTEPLLAALVDGARASHLFAWLAGLSFMSTGPSGLFPHDLVRELLAADLRWRAPERHLALLERAQAHYFARIESARDAEVRRLCFDWLFLQRDVPLMGGSGWEAASHLRIELAQPSDVPALCALAARHEGAEAGELVAHWLAREPERCFVYRDARPDPAGFALGLWLEQITPAEAAGDPGTRAALRVLDRLGTLRAGERATLCRSWMARDAYQSPSPVHARMLNTGVSLQVTTPSLRYAFFVVADADFWAPMLTYAGNFRVADGDFQVGDRRFAMFVLDYRAVRPLDFLSGLMRAASTGDMTPPVFPSEVTRLEGPSFARAVHAALKHLNDPIALEQSPLVSSRLTWTSVAPHADRATRARALAGRLADAVAAVAGSPQGDRAHRALDATYVQRTPVHKQAAADLGLAWSTYKRHLAEGVGMVVERLWRREVES